MLKALYIDDEADRAQKYKEYWTTILSEINPTVQVETSTEFSPHRMQELRPHIVIVDNVVSKEAFIEEENVGAIFIASQKKLYSDILFILFTGQSFSIKTLGSIYPNPDIIVPKESIKSNRYRSDSLIPAIKEKLKRYPLNDIIFPDNADKASMRILEKELRSIIEQCTYLFVGGGSDPIDEIRLKRLAGGMSGASVFLAEVIGFARFHNVPCILRIGAADDIRREVENYNLYARLQMPHNLRVELLGTGFAGVTGGSMYAFALGNPEDTETVTKRISKNSLEENVVLIRDVLGQVIQGKNIGWYQDVGTPENLDEYFANAEEYIGEKDSRRIARIQERYGALFKDRRFRINADRITFDSKEYKLPRTFASLYSGLKIRKTICHGDLNTNNIIVSKDARRMAIIDFEYTGPDHVYKDFVSLEVSLRCYCTSGDGMTFEQIIDQEIRLNTDDGSGVDGMEVITAVRKACDEKYNILTDGDEKVKYCICLSFHLLKVAALDGWSKSQMERLVAALVAVLTVLESC